MIRENRTMEKHLFRYDDNTLFCGIIAEDLSEIDDKPRFSIVSFSIIVTFKDIDHDVTTSISHEEKLFSIYRSEYLLDYINKNS